ncbi:MAG: PBP1A family penicillin-binding protein [Actinomycetota bacterium]|nr:PBP1A family penicillin-binding protein [Actinomycetota bacterium]
MHPALRYFLTLVIGAFGLVGGLLLLSRPARAIVDSGQSEKLPAALELNELAQRSVVYDRNGGVLAVLHVDENRSPVTLDQVPKHVIDAVLDVEDDGFYEHGGVNVRSILRAALSNVESGSVRQGGSTITQQLVKQSLLTPERDIGRKAREAVLAVRLEQQMSKDEILERYLNTVYLGNTAYGLQAAAETYWGKQVGQLTVEEGAFLAGLIRNPVGYDPFKRPELARERRDLALDRMVVRRHLTPDQVTLLKSVPVPTKKENLFKTAQDYFVEEVEQHLLSDERLGATQSERYNAIFRGGLRIETTFDPRLQEIAQRQVDGKIPNTKGRFEAALISVEPKTGAVRAMVAGKDYATTQYNLATGRGGSGRQPGSSFKPVVLAAALEKGIGPEDTISGTEPCPIRIKGVEPNPYEPGNYEGSKGSNGPISAATVKSLNCAFVRLGLALDDDPFKSMDKVAATARRLGIPIPEDGKFGPSISLGAKEATPLEMASVYATFANDGVRMEPYFIERVLDREGKEVLRGMGEGDRVLEANVARTVTSVLRKVVDSGTGTRARQRDRVVAGKTGTSQEFRDAWFVGYTPELATAVWMGNPKAQDSMTNVGGIRVTGGSYPATVWGAYMAEAMKGAPVGKFIEPNLAAFGKAEPVKLSKESGTTNGGKVTVTTVRRRRPTTPTTTTGVGGTTRTTLEDDGTTATTSGPATTRPPSTTPTTASDG